MKRRQAVSSRRVQPLRGAKVQKVTDTEAPHQGPPAYLVKALEHVQAGQLEVAKDLLKQHIQEDPLTAYSNLGNVYLLEDRFEEAQDAFQKAFDLNQRSTGTAIELARTLASQQRVQEAVDTLLTCLKLQHDSPSIRTVTNALNGYQAQEAALAVLTSLQNGLPDNLEIQFERALMLKITGDVQRAEQALLTVLDKQAHMVVYYELARLYRDTDRPGKATACLQQVVTLNPDQIEFAHDLGNTLAQAGLVGQGVDILKQALEKWPDHAMLRSDFLEHSHNLPEATPESLLEGYKQWSQRHAPASVSEISHHNAPDLNRVLRIGYLSPDFCEPSVSCFVEPLVESHHRDRVEVHGYGAALHGSDAAERIKGRFDHFQDIVTLDDQAVAEQVRQDKIDILVDLSGHISGHRLGVMALKPAPIQVTYLGHSGTTGLSQIDYRMTATTAESEQSRQCTTEAPVDLPEGFHCYRPPEKAPEVTEAPIVKNGYVTFGSFNHQTRINRNMIALWSKILLNTPDARFLLKLCVGDDEAVKAAYLECFAFYGIPAERIDIQTLETAEDPLTCMGSVDIALDTYPHNGTSTTCETLWMGVPVITLKGDLHCSRVGHSLLSQLSMAFLAVDTPDQYVTMACALASKSEAICQLRESMRLRMEASPLCQADAFAGHVEDAYQQMWHAWCQKSLAQVV
ncbi:MAG: tetratricopeptide repeat protein [Planctomycetes bacterium]|nr:tetratricopeptide repeat protein [Planctomycetota bacterium]